MQGKGNKANQMTVDGKGLSAERGREKSIPLDTFFGQSQTVRFTNISIINKIKSVKGHVEWWQLDNGICKCRVDFEHRRGAIYL